MSIRLRIDGKIVEFAEDTVTLGSDPACTVPLEEVEDLAARHAVIRKIAGRWIVEVREGSFIQVGDEPKSRMQWLSNGDVIRLTDHGPEITFEPSGADSNSAREVVKKPEPFRPVLRTKTDSPSTREDDNSLQLSKPRQVVVPPIEDVIELEEVQNQPTPKPKPIKSRPQNPVPEEPDLPTIPTIKSKSWLESTSATAAARQQRARRAFWLQIGGVGLLALVAIAVWRFGSNPVTDNSNSSTESPVTHTDPPARPKDEDQKVATNKTPDKPVVDPKISKEEEPKNVVTKPKVEVSEEPMVPVLKEVPKPDKTSPVETVSEEVLAAVSPAIFAVFAKHPEQDGYFRLGTGWAASRRHVVTSGAVAIAAEELQREGMSIAVSQPSLKAPITIKTIRVHAAYRTGLERAATAREQIEAAKKNPREKSPDDSSIAPEDELRQALSLQARFDLGVFDILSGQRLPSPLTINSSDLPDVSKVEYSMIGSPYSGESYRVESPAEIESPKGRVNRRGTAAKSDKNLTLTMPFSEDVSDLNWSGSPILDPSRRVIGIYSRPSKLFVKNDKSPRQHAVIWLGRLREFAPEVEE